MPRFEASNQSRSAIPRGMARRCGREGYFLLAGPLPLAIGSGLLGSPRGGAGRDRTGDLLNAIQALSQLSYGPTREAQANPTHGVLSKVTFQPTYSRKTNRAWGMLEVPAGVVKLVYAGDSKSPGRKAVRVRFPPPAP